jgi:hypothetical protein
MIYLFLATKDYKNLFLHTYHYRWLTAHHTYTVLYYSSKTFLEDFTHSGNLLESGYDSLCTDLYQTK